MTVRWLRVAGVAVLMGVLQGGVLLAQAGDNALAGDHPADAGPMATGLSAELTPAAIEAAMEKVADWQVATREDKFNRQWTFAALYRGLLTASVMTGNPAYRDAVLKLAEKYDWKLDNTRFPHADDMAVGWSYERLYIDQTFYGEKPDPVRIADVKATLDRLVERQDDPKKLLWWWCDALFMAPPVMAQMSAITHDRKYLDYMDKEWWETSKVLYDPEEHLYFRDETFLHKTEKNGKKMFWSRGNGWVLAGLAQVLQVMPADYPTRDKYIAQFKEMAEKVRSLQQADGLWKMGLLDQADYANSEISGSGFFTYGLAWGIHNHILDAPTYMPVVQKAWAGMLTHVYASGRLGAIQPIGAAPGEFAPSASYVYGVGAFELAGAELDRLSGGRAKGRARVGRQGRGAVRPGAATPAAR